MEETNRSLLRFFDYCTAALNGLVTALLTVAVVSPEWPAISGMFTGMILGTACLIAIFLGLGWIAGAFEIIMPGMFIVMIVGMASGMWITMGAPSTATLAMLGILIGLYTCALFHMHDKSLYGETSVNKAQG